MPRNAGRLLQTAVYLVYSFIRTCTGLTQMATGVRHNILVFMLFLSVYIYWVCNFVESTEYVAMSLLSCAAAGRNEHARTSTLGAHVQIMCRCVCACTCGQIATYSVLSAADICLTFVRRVRSRRSVCLSVCLSVSAQCYPTHSKQHASVPVLSVFRRVHCMVVQLAVSITPPEPDDNVNYTRCSLHYTAPSSTTSVIW